MIQVHFYPAVTFTTTHSWSWSRFTFPGVGLPSCHIYHNHNWSWSKFTFPGVVTFTTTHSWSWFKLTFPGVVTFTTTHSWSWFKLTLGLSRLPQPTVDHDSSSLSLLSRLPQPTVDHDSSSLSLGLGCPAVTFTATTTDHDPGLAQHCEYDSYMIASDPQRHMNGHNVHKTSHSWAPPLKQKEMKERAKSEMLCQEGLSTAVGRIYNRIPLTVLLHHIYGTLSLSAKRDEAVCYSCIKIYVWFKGTCLLNMCFVQIAGLSPTVMRG